MKRITLILLCSVLLYGASAQQKKKDKWHPFSNVPPLSFYAEFNGFGQQVAGESAVGLGGKAAVTWNAKNAIGFTFGSTINKFSPSFERDTAVYLKTVLTGVYYERTFLVGGKVEFILPIAAGVGEAYYDWRELDDLGRASFPYDEEYYFYVEPAARVSYRLAKKWKVVGGVTYAFAPFDFDYRAVTNQAVSGARYQLGIRYGRFWN